MLTSRLAMTALGVGLLLMSFAGITSAGVSTREQPFQVGEATPEESVILDQDFDHGQFLPLVLHPVKTSTGSSPIVHVPYFEESIVLKETAIFWFGEVSPTKNYTDVRIGYSANELFIYLNIFDRSVWYNPDPSLEDLTHWDAATLYLDRNQAGSVGITGNSYRFVGQLNFWEPQDRFQAAYQGINGEWIEASIPFIPDTSWRGDAPNQDLSEDRGWRIGYQIPFTSLGLSGPPPPETTWRLALAVHDRDDASGSPIEEKRWPVNADFTQPGTWGALSFGLPAFQPSSVNEQGNITIRHKLDSETVTDGMVGGGTNCGRGMDFFAEWGEKNYAGKEQINIQNQSDVADWPCFSKFYITFPLERIPAGKAILSAQVTLFHFGSAGGGVHGVAYPSLIQVSTVNEDWDEATLTWNNAPLAQENVSRAWVEWVDPSSPFEWPGFARTWDVGRAVADAYASGSPLRLVFYSADTPMHSGKYFISSDTQDWNEAARPKLEVTWGDP